MRVLYRGNNKQQCYRAWGRPGWRFGIIHCGIARLFGSHAWVPSGNEVHTPRLAHDFVRSGCTHTHIVFKRSCWTSSTINHSWSWIIIKPQLHLLVVIDIFQRGGNHQPVQSWPLAVHSVCRFVILRGPDPIARTCNRLTCWKRLKNSIWPLGLGFCWLTDLWFAEAAPSWLLFVPLLLVRNHSKG